MVNSTPSLIDQLSGWLRHGHLVAVADADLLRRLAAGRDEESFMTLLDRHGPRVWGVCRRIAVDSHLAEDVFQATFLLLIQNAHALRKPAALAAWLHGTAYRLAVQTRRRSRRREGVDKRAAKPVAVPPDDVSSREMFAILDKELTRLPEVYRGPLILCYFDGLTQDDAARRLGISAGAIKGRLERGRARLADRLKRHGIKSPALLLTPLAAVAVPASLSARTLELIHPGVALTPAVAAFVAAASPSVAAKIGVALMILIVALIAGVSLALSGAEQPFDPPSPSKSEAAAKSEVEMLPAGAVARLGTTRLRPGGSVEYMAFSPDGKKLVSWSENGGTSHDGFIWDVATGRELNHLDIPGVRARSCVWLPDGRGVATVNLNWMEDGGFFLWDFTSENAVKPPSGAGKGIGLRMIPAQPPDNEADACFAVTTDAKIVAVGRSGNEKRERPIELREFHPGHRTGELKTIRRLGSHPENCDAVRFTPDGRTLLSFSKLHNNTGKPPKESLVIIWDIADGKESRRLTVPAPLVQEFRPVVAVSNQFLALGMEDEVGTLRLYDLKSGQERTIRTGHEAIGSGSGYGVSAVAFSPDGRTVVTGGRDRLVRIWDVADGKQVRVLDGHCSWVETLAVSPDGKTLASSGQDGVIRLWDIATGADACPQPGHAGGLAGISVSPEGKTAVTAGRDGTLRIWDVDHAREQRMIKASGNVARAELSPDGKTVVVGGFGQPLRMWDLATGIETRPAGMPADVKAIRTQFFDARTLMTTREEAVSIWDWPGGSLRRTFDLPPPEKQPGTPYCESATLSPDGKWLVTVANRSWHRDERGMRFGYAADGVIELWNATSGKRVRRLIQSEGCPRAAIFTANGELVLQGGGHLLDAEGKVETDLKDDLNLIDPLTSRLRRTFAPAPVKPGVTHRYVMALALSPDGRSLYVADSAGATVVYEVATGRVRRAIAGHRTVLTGLAITRDGKRLLTSSLDATALVWDLSPSAAFPRPIHPPIAEELTNCWNDLADSDAAAAFRVMAILDAAPKEAITILAAKMSPATACPEAATLDKLVAELGNEKFPAREKASAELDKLGESAVPGLRERLVDASSVETRRRILRLLDKHDPPETAPHRLQTLRALEVLEGLGTPEAKAILAKLASGAAGARLTREAGQSLDRLRVR